MDKAKKKKKEESHMLAKVTIEWIYPHVASLYSQEVVCAFGPSLLSSDSVCYNLVYFVYFHQKQLRQYGKSTITSLEASTQKQRVLCCPMCAAPIQDHSLLDIRN